MVRGSYVAEGLWDVLEQLSQQGVQIGTSAERNQYAWKANNTCGCQTEQDDRMGLYGLELSCTKALGLETSWLHGS